MCEEEDELQRSTKKVKETLESSNIPLNNQSYRDKLKGEIHGAYYQAFNFNSYEDGGYGGRWSNAIIVKVFGNIVGFHFLYSRITSLWKPGGRLDVVDLGKDIFLVKFGLKEDLDRVLKEGPWFIGEHFLTIRPWVPNFKLSTTSVSSVAIWA